MRKSRPAHQGRRHVIEECVKIAAEADFLPDLLELLRDPSDLAKSKLVDLLRRHRRRRRRLYLMPIQRVAALHVHLANAVASMPEIVVLKEVAEPCQRWINDGRNRLTEFVRQARALRRSHIVRRLPERAPIRRVLGLQLQLAVELLDHVADGELGVDHAFRLAPAPLANRLVDIGGEVAVALQRIVIVAKPPVRRPALPARQGRIEGVQAIEMVHRQRLAQAQEIGLEAAERVLGLELEHIVGKLVGGREIGSRDCRERPKIILGRYFLALVMRVAEQVADPIRVTIIAAEQCLQRITLEARLVARLEELEQPVVCLLLGSRSCCRQRRRCLGYARESKQRNGKDQSARNVHHGQGPR